MKKEIRFLPPAAGGLSHTLLLLICSYAQAREREAYLMYGLCVCVWTKDKSEAEGKAVLYLLSWKKNTSEVEVPPPLIHTHTPVPNISLHVFSLTKQKTDHIKIFILPLLLSGSLYEHPSLGP